MSRAQQVHSESMHKTTYHSEITLYPLDWEAAAKECRICLSTLERPSNRFVSPCDCNGTLKYVHVGCLREWVAAKESRKVQGEFASKLTCELCMQPMRAETQMRLRCLNAERACERIGEKLLLFVICTVGMVLNISLLCYSIVELVRSAGRDYEQTGEVDKVVFILSIVVNTLLLGFFIFHASWFVVERRVELTFGEA